LDGLTHRSRRSSFKNARESRVSLLKVFEKLSGSPIGKGESHINGIAGKPLNDFQSLLGVCRRYNRASRHLREIPLGRLSYNQ
jgi:hypothetical protein